MNVFERAARGQWRYTSNRGELTTEQLFSLPLSSKDGFDLNNVAVVIDDAIERTARKNFIAPVQDTERSKLEGKLEVVKHIIASKLADAAAAEKRQKNAEERQRILDALYRKENAELESASREELLERLEAISG